MTRQISIRYQLFVIGGAVVLATRPVTPRLTGGSESEALVYIGDRNAILRSTAYSQFIGISIAPATGCVVEPWRGRPQPNNE